MRTDTLRTERHSLLAELQSVLPTANALDVATGGLSGVCAAVALDAIGRKLAFVKWSDDLGSEAAAQIRTEGANPGRVSAFDGVATVLHFNPAGPVLSVEFISPASGKRWDDQTLPAAAGTLRALRETTPAGLPLLRNRADFRDRGTVTLDALVACTGDRTLSAVFDARYRALREDLDDTAVCHSATHPDNWVLSPDGTVLVDFALLALGPAGFGETFLPAHLDVPVGDRIRWLAERAGRR